MTVSETTESDTPARETIIDRAKAENVAIRCVAPDGSVCDIVAQPLEVVDDYVWIQKWSDVERSYATRGEIIPLYDAVHNRIHRCTPDVELIDEDESLFGGSDDE